MAVWDLRDKVAVAGIGYSEIARRSSRTLASLTVEACDRALEDCGLGRADIDGIATSPSMPRYGGERGIEEGIDVITPHYLTDALGIAAHVLWTGSTLGMVTQSVMDAAMAIHSGVCTTALVYRSLHVPAGRYVNFEAEYAAGPEQFKAPFGFSMPPAWAATVLRRYLALFQFTRSDMAPHIVANREIAQKNPHAYWRGQSLTEKDYLSARLIADPICILDCDIPVDGAVALILTSTPRARHLRRPPALLTGFAASTHTGASEAAMNLDDLWEGSALTGRRLWESAGVGPREIDTAQLYDGFSVFVYTWLEGLGFVARGEGLPFMRDGRGSLTGELPVNTGGGALSEGRLHGMTHLAEGVIQVTDRGGARQVPGASRALVTVSNGLSRSTAFVFSRDG
jgi:acetyl-CoA acetyltransferase